jgi:hypothetical protein
MRWAVRRAWGDVRAAGLPGTLGAACLAGWLAVGGGLSTTNAAPVEADGPLAFESYVLTLPGRVELTYYEDIDEDGLVDVLGVYRGNDVDDPPRNVVVYFQRPDGFPTAPDLAYRVPDEVCVIDLGDVAADSPGRELVMLDGSSVRWLPLQRPSADAGNEEGSPPRLLVEVDPLFARAQRLGLAKRDFAQELDESPRATLFIPRTEGYRVYYPDDEYATYQDFPIEHTHRVRSNSYSVQAATIHLADVNGDGHDDLAMSHLDKLQVHFQVDERFETAPGLDLDLEVITPLDREAPEPIEDLVGFDIEDFDGDSLADLFLWKTIVRKKAVINDKKQYQMFRNRNGSFPVLPDQAFILKSFDRPEVLDLDGDGRLDMVTGYLDFTLGNIIKALLAKRFSIELSFFLFGDDGFPPQPDEERSFKIHFSLSNMDENFQPAVEIKGDYDGDKNLDFLLQTEDDRVEIFLADRASDHLFEKDASVRLKTPACEHAYVADFNGDGRADMAFDRFPDREPFDPAWINVVLSR